MTIPAAEHGADHQHASAEQGVPWPAPWRIDRDWPVQSRARILDANGNKVIGGMNHAKAEFIVAAVNRNAQVSDLVTSLEAMCINMASDGHAYRDCYLKARFLIARVTAERTEDRQRTAQRE